MMTGEYQFDGIFLGGECAEGFADQDEGVANCLPFADLLYPMMVGFVVLVRQIANLGEGGLRTAAG